MNRRGFFRFLGITAVVGATVPAQIMATLARPPIYRYSGAWQGATRIWSLPPSVPRLVRGSFGDLLNQRYRGLIPSAARLNAEFDKISGIARNMLGGRVR